MEYIITFLIISIIIPGILGFCVEKKGYNIYTMVIIMLVYISTVNLIMGTFVEQGYNEAMKKTGQVISDIGHENDQCTGCMNSLLFKLHDED